MLIHSPEGLIHSPEGHSLKFVVGQGFKEAGDTPRPKYAFSLPNFRPDPFTVFYISPFSRQHAKLYTLFQTSRQNIPNLRPKSIPVFKPKRLKNHTLWGGNTSYIAYTREYPIYPRVHSASKFSSQISLLNRLSNRKSRGTRWGVSLGG